MYHKFVSTLNRYTEWITILFLAVMVTVVFLQIVSREILGFSFPWTEELSRYLLVWVAFLASGFAFQYGAHISIEVFVNKFGNVGKRIFEIIFAIISIIFAIILITKGTELVLASSMNRSPALQIPMSIVYSAIPIGALLQVINILDIIFRKKYSTRGEV